jgi:hypothetical protein
MLSWPDVGPRRGYASAARAMDRSSISFQIQARSPTPSASSLAEGVTIDTEGNLYGADFLNDMRKFVLKKK